MAGRSQLPVPTRSSQRVTSVVRTVVEPPAEQPCPARSRLPRPSGLRPPRSYRPSPAAPCAPQVRGARPSGLRPPQVRSGLRPPQASGLRAPRPVCRLPQRVQTPPRARSPCAPAPCAPPPCAPAPCAPAPCAPPPCAPPPCPAASPRSQLRAMESDQEAAIRAALSAQWEAAMSCPPESPEQQQQRREEQRICEERAARARDLAESQQYLAAAKAEVMRREFEETCRDYELTREAIAEMLIEDRDLMLRTQQERMLRRLAYNVCSEAEWRAHLGQTDEWRQNMLTAYIPFAEYEAQFYADREVRERKRKRFRQQLRLRRPPLSPLSEPQVDVFDDSPPCACPLPLLPKRLFDAPPPCAPTLNFMDTSPPLDSELPPPLLRSYRSPSPTAPEQAEDDWYHEFDSLRDPCRELLFDSEDDDDSQLEGAVGGACR